MQNESATLQEIRSGDVEAFRRLYDAHVTPLYRFLKQFARDDNQIHEWTQRAFIRAYENIGTFEGRSRFSTWLFQIAINEVHMDRRRASVIPFVSESENGHSGVEDPREKFEWEATMKTWLHQLGETRRMVFILYEVEGYSHAEIGGMLGINESTSRTILSRAKDELRALWKEEHKQR
ncbi:MAG: RNA polymerase sigma factor [Bacteroidota bacterium]